MASVLVDDLKYWQILALELGCGGLVKIARLCKSNITGWLKKQFVVSSAVVSVLREVK